MNERLRTTMLQVGVSVDDLANLCDVDPKTASRWIRTGRVPHREHRWKTARRLQVDEVYLWPELLERDRGRRAAVAESELLATHADRASVPRDTWLSLVSGAKANIDVLVFSGTFFAQTNPRIAEMLAERARAGVKVRLCFGNPASAAVELRDKEEGLRGTLASKIRASLTYYRSLIDVPSCELRLHGASVYASLFRFDNDLIVNPHIWGMPASANPVLHIRRLDGGGWFESYTKSFDMIWSAAAPLKSGDEEGA